MSQIDTLAYKLAGEIAAAVAADEAPSEGGCDISAGLFGPNATTWLKGIAARLLSTEWAPVSDTSLPPEETPVLILLSSGKRLIAERRWQRPGRDDTYEAFWYWACPYDLWDNVDLDVTHWAPLLEART